MRLALQTTAKLGRSGGNRAGARRALSAAQRSAAAPGTSGFNEDDDTTLKSCGAAKITANDATASVNCGQ